MDGDGVSAERWRPLGPMTAMNGVLLFGWSTAAILIITWAVFIGGLGLVFAAVDFFLIAE